MRLTSFLSIAAVAVFAANPLAAQEQPIEYDRTTTVTLEGTVETVVWSMAQGSLQLRPAGQSQEWEITLPNSKTLLDMGISAEILSRGAPVTMKVHKAKNDACRPRCAAEGIELTLNRQGKSYALAQVQSAG